MTWSSNFFFFFSLLLLGSILASGDAAGIVRIWEIKSIIKKKEELAIDEEAQTLAKYGLTDDLKPEDEEKDKEKNEKILTQVKGKFMQKLDLSLAHSLRKEAHAIEMQHKSDHLQEFKESKEPEAGKRLSVTCFVLNATECIVGDNFGWVSIWDLASCEVVQWCEGHGTPITCLQVSSYLFFCIWGD